MAEGRGPNVLRSHPATAALRHAAGWAELSSHFGAEVVALAEEVHQAFRWRRRGPAGAGIYGRIREAFGLARHAAVRGGRIAAGSPRPDGLLDVQSAVNGAFGHVFEETGSAFSLPMTLLRSGRSDGVHRSRRLVFVHGLCMNERAWHNPEHGRFRAWASRRLDAGSLYVRYNSGLRISTNGRRLAELLERRDDGSEIVLVGHSMGGLVARSALHQGEAAGHGWPHRVSRLVCLGSPHEGTSWERLGNHANRLLGVSPWTRPFMRLGNLRSDGIRDLRFGHLVEEDWCDRHPDDPRRAHSRVPLAGHVDHLHVAASLARRSGPSDRLGDGLVPVGSALAWELHPEEDARRELVRGIGHFALLADERVYAILRRWIEATG